MSKKIIDADIVSGIDTQILDEMESSPATPLSGKFKLYAKADGNIYGKNDSGVEFLLGAISAPPTVQRFTSGSGTYTTPANVKYLEIEMVSGAPGGSGNSDANAGTAGGNTTFGTSLLTCTAPAVGTWGALGSTTVNSPAISVTRLAGVLGSRYSTVVSANGGDGGNTPFGGGGPGGSQNVGGGAATANTGSGGGGGGGGNSAGSSGGANSGSYLKAIIHSPSASYSYSVGAGGAGGAGGANGPGGGTGGSGVIIVKEHY